MTEKQFQTFLRNLDCMKSEVINVYDDYIEFVELCDYENSVKYDINKYSRLLLLSDNKILETFYVSILLQKPFK